MMSAEPYRFQFSWKITDGDPGKQIACEQFQDEQPEIVSLDRLLDLDTCLVLEAGESKEACDLTITCIPLYLPRMVSLVAECPVIEMYVGRLNEYDRTYHGELVYSLEDVKVFRFDIPIAAEVDQVQLKFMTCKDLPLCLYGTRMYLQRNPNPLKMFVGPKIDPVGVQLRLEDLTLSEKAEQCKNLIIGAATATATAATAVNENVLNNNVQQSTDHTDAMAKSFGELLISGHAGTAGQSHSSLLEAMLKQYIDLKFGELSSMIDSKLACLESRQNQKLEQILALLQSK